MKTLNKRKDESQKGFTLVELITVVSIIGVLASIAVPQFASSRHRALDTAAKSDLRNAINFLELYFTENDSFPATSAELLTTGFNLSQNVSFTNYKVETMTDGEPTVHMHLRHASSSNAWHANYPKEGTEIQIR